MKNLLLSLVVGVTFMASGTGCKSAKVRCSYEDLSGKWIVSAIDGKIVDAAEKPFIEFNTAEKRTHGRGSCNIINSSFELKEDDPCAISFRMPISTMMACPDMVLEGEYMKAITNTAAFKVAGNELNLLDANGAVVMELVKE